MNWEMTTRLGGALQHPITGITFGWEKIRSFGYSSLKSRDIRGVHSRSDKIYRGATSDFHVAFSILVYCICRGLG